MPERQSPTRSWLTAHRPDWTRSDTALVLVALAVVVLRWSDRARYLLSWDADTFAIALEDYNVRGLHPHAPGYPLFVALGWLSNQAWPSANDAYIFLGVAFTVASGGMTYALGRQIANRAVGLAAATLLLAAPLVYVHSVTANVYTADMACSLAVAWAAWSAHHDPTRRRLLVLAATFALAVGIRPSIVLFLAPVVAWGALRPAWNLATQAQRLLPGAALGAAIALAWFLPMAFLSGGIGSWSEANRLQSSQVVFGTTAWSGGWPILRANLDRMALFFHWELAWLLPALAVLVVAGILAGRRASQPPTVPGARKVAVFLAVWLLPATAFYLTIFNGWNEGPSGYALVLLGGVFLAATGLGVAAWRRLDVRAPRMAAALALLALAVPVAGFTLHLHDVRDVNYRAHDEWAAAWSTLPATFPPSNTSLVASYEFAHVWYSFPDYTSYNYRPPAQGPGETPDFLLIQEAHGRRATPDWYDSIADRVTAGPHPLQPGVENLILFDFQLAGENGGTRAVRDDVPVHEAHLPNGWRVLYVAVEDGRPNLEDYFTMDGALP